MLYQTVEEDVLEIPGDDRYETNPTRTNLDNYGRYGSPFNDDPSSNGI